MSADPAPSKQGAIRADAGLGVVIRVTDGFGREFGSGIASLDVKVPPGLYAVGWTAAGSTAETVVRAVAGEETVVRPPWDGDRFGRSKSTGVFGQWPV